MGFGSLGTAVYLGVTIGSLAASQTFSGGRNVQKILAFCMGVNCVCLFIFSMSTVFYFNLSLRILNGIGQAYIAIYMPVWADAFGSESQKTIWVTTFLLCASIGVTAGFGLTAVLNV